MVNKFIVLMQICTAMTGECSDWYTDSKKYNTTKECLLHGYERAMDVVKNLEEDYIVENKIGIRFKCEGIPSDGI